LGMGGCRQGIWRRGLGEGRGPHAATMESNPYQKTVDYLTSGPRTTTSYWTLNNWSRCGGTRWAERAASVGFRDRGYRNQNICRQILQYKIVTASLLGHGPFGIADRAGQATFYGPRKNVRWSPRWIPNNVSFGWIFSPVVGHPDLAPPNPPDAP